MSKVKRALISVFDKKGVVEFAQGLNDLGIEIISTGGTARVLREGGIKVIPISEVTGYPEMLDGRVKTLHPVIHAGLLALRNKPEHVKQCEEHNIKGIDLVIVNLYPFEETISNPEATLAEAIEQIDIGGVALIRSAAKNFNDVAVVVGVQKYGLILEELKNNDRSLTKESRMRLAADAFKYTSQYDNLIHTYLRQLTQPKKVDFPNEITLNYAKSMDLRYGENPHQKAAFYREVLPKGVVTGEPRINLTKQLHGKQMSFNNLMDVDAALNIIKDFSLFTAVIIKHTNPCGMASGDTLLNAYKKALATDPISSFGSIISLNGEVNEALAQELNKLFVEVLIAPSYTNSALNILKAKKNIRILVLPELKEWKESKNRQWRVERDIKKVLGGILLQDRDISSELSDNSLKVVTKITPTQQQMNNLAFSWQVAKHVKSNAIVIGGDRETIGVGAGQMSRVDAVKIAVMKAVKPIEGSVLASDAFFPFKDAVEEAAKIGIKAIIQPGGSMRDEEVIDCANELGIAMVFTGVRHFKH